MGPQWLGWRQGALGFYIAFAFKWTAISLSQRLVHSTLPLPELLGLSISSFLLFSIWSHSTNFALLEAEGSSSRGFWAAPSKVRWRRVESGPNPALWSLPRGFFTLIFLHPVCILGIPSAHIPWHGYSTWHWPMIPFSSLPPPPGGELCF